MSLAIQKASEALVTRAREGDENAMAIICEVRENRKKGNPKAALAFDYMMRHIKKTPPRKSSITTMLGGPEETSFEPLSNCIKRNVTGPLYGKTVVKFVLNMGKSVDDSQLASYILATGRPIDRTALRDVLGCIPPEIRELFGQGYRAPLTASRFCKGLKPEELKCLQLGYILGMARAVQKVRDDDSAPLRLLSSSVAWELGE